MAHRLAVRGGSHDRLGAIALLDGAIQFSVGREQLGGHGKRIVKVGEGRHAEGHKWLTPQGYPKREVYVTPVVDAQWTARRFPALLLNP